MAQETEITFKKFVCMRGHAIYSLDDMAGYMCPYCLGKLTPESQLTGLNIMLIEATEPSDG